MKKLQFCFSIILISLTLFSCDKNEWTPEKETEFKRGVKDGLQSKAKGFLSEDQVNYITDCTFEKLKSKNLKPNDGKKQEIRLLVKEMAKECTQESFSKKKNGSNEVWPQETEKAFKELIKNKSIDKGMNSKDGAFMADCLVTKLKEQNIGPADLQDRETLSLIAEIGKTCREELTKE